MLDAAGVPVSALDARVVDDGLEEALMARIASRPTVTLAVTIELTEEEAAALDALFGYDVEAFLATFYEKMGRAYLEPHEKGLRSLHQSRGMLSGPLNRAAQARRVFNGV